MEIREGAGKLGVRLREGAFPKSEPVLVTVPRDGPVPPEKVARLGR